MNCAESHVRDCKGTDCSHGDRGSAKRSKHGHSHFLYGHGSAVQCHTRGESSHVLDNVLLDTGQRVCRAGKALRNISFHNLGKRIRGPLEDECEVSTRLQLLAQISFPYTIDTLIKFRNLIESIRMGW